MSARSELTVERIWGLDGGHAFGRCEILFTKLWVHACFEYLCSSFTPVSFPPPNRGTAGASAAGVAELGPRRYVAVCWAVGRARGPCGGNETGRGAQEGGGRRAFRER